MKPCRDVRGGSYATHVPSARMCIGDDPVDGRGFARLRIHATEILYSDHAAVDLVDIFDQLS